MTTPEAECKMVTFEIRLHVLNLKLIKSEIKVYN